MMDQVNLEKMLEQGTDNALLRYTLGSLFLKQKAYAQAVEHLTQAVTLDPQHSASWKHLGKALTGIERIEEAVESYQKGIEVAETKGDIQAAKEMRVFLKRLE
ncbi:MAG: tetratricopeptide repeat protein [Candidatus Thiodiazotropha lotti]|uniref:Tetratricopeptide repeat protein n=1 Tax=Candidatus Thiodiazotropha lotti TaxID=2792787 RepID=A0A9E4K2V4_9GAMM|nr:tetratricopeptide repeat protein [Candidatus Thiodiazotropha lotti]MCG8007404.1 tetratricopeptide repeat protein [Candidatus Thiodiazotropha lotti]MCW4194988.1 tetratricopeptide repeat protein [Candidatus Thiodiazotropha lotti]MCW4203094.1 tetratricopeptide repeat protein [Candidatus Thiodiazotropha lotti]